MEQFGIKYPTKKRVQPEIEDTSAPESFQAFEKEHIDRFNRLLRERIERQRKGEQRHDWMGNPLPPMLIEPFPTRANRLARELTDEERQLRRQFLRDQKVPPGEPKFVQELEPRNFFRRTLSAPWNAAALLVRNIWGQRVASNFRNWAPKLLLTYVTVTIVWYHLKYHGHSWEWTHGFRMYNTHPTLYRGDKKYPVSDPDAEDFSDYGFKARKSMKSES